MPEEVIHIYLEHKRIAGKEMWGIYIPALIIFTFIMVAIDAVFRTVKLTDMILLVIFGWGSGGGLMLLQYFWLCYRGENFPDELIVYDNGWFVVWGPVYSDGWVAPSTLEWILPDKITLKPWGVIQNIFHVSESKKRKRADSDKIKVGGGLSWVYPLNPKYDDYFFHNAMMGYISKDKLSDMKRLAEYFDRIGRRNIEAGRVWIPSGKPQANFIYMKKPFYWNDIFRKEGLRDYYIEETGEDLPEPVRSYLYNARTYSNKYLKMKKETGDWLSRREGASKEWYIDWDWLEKWIEEH